MRSMKLALVAAAALATVAAVAAPAFSQGGAGQAGATVAVVSIDRLLIASEIGKDVSNKVNAIRGQMQQELQPDVSKFNEAQASFNQSLERAKTERKSAQEFLQAPTTIAQRQLIQQTGQELDRKTQDLARDLAFTRQKAIEDLLTTVDPILEEVMRQKGISLALADSAVVRAVGTEVDLTPDVLRVLNERARTQTVVRLRAPPPEQPLEAIAPPPAKKTR